MTALHWAAHHDDWKIGHPVVFPNMLRQGTFSNRGGGGFQIRVPLDDTHTAHWWYRCYQMQDGDTEQTAETIPFYQVPVPELDEEDRAEWDKLDNNSGQDLVAWITQGAIADRTEETLGRSDKGLILYRQQLLDNVAKVERGEDPMNVFRDPGQNEYLRLPTEESGGTSRMSAMGQNGRMASSAGLAGGASKFSPVLNRDDGAVTVTAEEVLSGD